MMDGLECYLYEKYDYFNRKHFGGKLPTVKIGLRNHPRLPPNVRERLGRAHMGVTRYDKNCRPTEIVLYRLGNSNLRQYNETLLHEMIHVEQLMKGRSPDHDRWFIRRAEQLGLKGEIMDEE